MIDMKDVKAGTIIVVCGKLAIVVEVSPTRYKNPIAYKNNTEHRGYICGPGDVDAVLGDVPLEKFQNVTQAPPPRQENVGTDVDFMVPSELRGIKVGDEIMIRHGYVPTKVIYKGYKNRRPKYPILYEVNGTLYKATMTAYIGKAA